jgi:hypothetical protein
MQQRTGNVNTIFFYRVTVHCLLRAVLDSETEGGIFLKRLSQENYSNPAAEKYLLYFKGTIRPGQIDPG